MSRKRPRDEPEQLDPFGPGGLYDFLPAPDPEKDALAKEVADQKNKAKPPLPPEDRTKVIFLDVDGVLLPAGSVETIFIDGVALPVRADVKHFVGGALDNLRLIVEHTGACIVLSSEWRRSETLFTSINAVLKGHEIPVCCDSTPILKPRADLEKAKVDSAIVWCERRAREISAWLRLHKEVTAWVALDDLNFTWADDVRITGTSFIKYRSVHTNATQCITDSDKADAVSILLNPPPEPRPDN